MIGQFRINNIIKIFLIFFIVILQLIQILLYISLTNIYNIQKLNCSIYCCYVNVESHQHSILDHCNPLQPIRSISIQFGPLQSILVHFGLFSPIWSILVFYGPLRSKSVPFGPFNPFRPNMVQFICFWFILVHSVQFDLFCFI